MQMNVSPLMIYTIMNGNNNGSEAILPRNERERQREPIRNNQKIHSMDIIIEFSKSFFSQLILINIILSSNTAHTHSVSWCCRLFVGAQLILRYIFKNRIFAHLDSFILNSISTHFLMMLRRHFKFDCVSVKSIWRILTQKNTCKRTKWNETK